MYTKKKTGHFKGKKNTLLTLRATFKAGKKYTGDLDDDFKGKEEGSGIVDVSVQVLNVISCSRVFVELGKVLGRV